MTTITGINEQAYEDYIAIYTKYKGEKKYALTYKTFVKRLNEGKTIYISDVAEFMSNKTFGEWLNHEAAMLAAHG